MDLPEIARRTFSLSYRVAKRLYGFFFIRPLQRYNAESRAMKLLDKIQNSDKPLITSPKHPPTEKFLEELIQKHPEIMESVKKTPKEIIEGVNKIKIKATIVPSDFNVKEESDESRFIAKLLPERRRKMHLSEMGVKDPDKVPVGKLSLREAIQLIKAHTMEPENFSVEKIAKVHDLELHDVENVLDYFKPFWIYRPEGSTVPKNKMPWYTPGNIADMYLKESVIYERHRLHAIEEGKKQLEEKEEEAENAKSSPQSSDQTDKSSDPTGKSGGDKNKADKT